MDAGDGLGGGEGGVSSYFAEFVFEEGEVVFWGELGEEVED